MCPEVKLAATRIAKLNNRIIKLEISIIINKGNNQAGTTGSKVAKIYLSAVPNDIKTNVTQKINDHGRITTNSAIGVSAPLETANIVTLQIII